MPESIGELVRKAENDFTRGNTQISKYVSHSLSDTLETIVAYLNYTPTSGKFDGNGNEKPFANISIGAANIWYRATDVDRKDIKIRTSKTKEWVNSFLATVVVQDWMRRTAFGSFLNEWGRTLSRFGSAVLKFVEKDGQLHIIVMPWLQMIVDAVDFDNNPKIEVLELTPAQLRRRVKSHGYNKAQVDALIKSVSERETRDRRKKDNKSGYIKLYEVHGEFSIYTLKKAKGVKDIPKADKENYSQQVHIISFVAKKENWREYDDFTLYCGEEKEDPYMITHLMKEDGRTLAMGAVEHLFHSQWMVNHSLLSWKNTLDLSSKILLQTADVRLFGNNLFNGIDNGEVLLHAPNMPLTKVEISKPDIMAWNTFAVTWKTLGNEINGISDAMLGQTKSGDAWRQTEAILEESHSLFEEMRENKGLALEDMFRQRILPYLKRTKLNSKEEISAIFDAYDIRRIDARFIKNRSIKNTNKRIAKKLFDMEVVTPEDQALMIQEERSSISDSLKDLGGQRFFSLDEISEKTWAKQLKDLEWDCEVDVTGESKDVLSALTTLNTVLRVMVQPGFAQNQQAQAVVAKALELSSVMSPLEYYALPAAAPQPTPTPTPSPTGQPGGIIQ